MKLLSLKLIVHGIWLPYFSMVPEIENLQRLSHERDVGKEGITVNADYADKMFYEGKKSKKHSSIALFKPII